LSSDLTCRGFTDMKFNKVDLNSKSFKVICIVSRLQNVINFICWLLLKFLIKLKCIC